MKKISLFLSMLLCAVFITGCSDDSAVIDDISDEPEPIVNVSQDDGLLDDEQQCLASLSQYKSEQMQGDPQTTISVSCYPKDYYGPEYITGYIYTTVYPDLGLKISTPEGAGWDMSLFLTKSKTPIFVRNENRISYIQNGEEAEYIQAYSKDPEESLPDLINQKHLNAECKVESYHQSEGQVYAPYSDGMQIYTVVGLEGDVRGDCIADDENKSGEQDYRLVHYFESQDKTKYYKVVFTDGCAPGPCSIFGKIELL